jgi:hypothetical protein
MTGIDLASEVERKLAKNATRAYEAGHDGVLRRVDDGLVGSSCALDGSA